MSLHLSISIALGSESRSIASFPGTVYAALEGTGVGLEGQWDPAPPLSLLESGTPADSLPALEQVRRDQPEMCFSMAQP